MKHPSMTNKAVDPKTLLAAPPSSPPTARYSLRQEEETFDNMQLVVHGFGASKAASSGMAPFDFTIRGSSSDAKLAAQQFEVVPYPLPGLGEHRVSRVACGMAHIVILMAQGQVYTAGDNASGALGFQGEARGPFALVEFSGAAVSVAAGPVSSAAVMEQGQFFVWGKVGSAKGTDNLLSSPSPQLIAVPEPVKQISMGNQFAVLVASDGARCFAWGSNAEFGLPVATEKSSYVARTPEPVLLSGGQHDGRVVFVHCHGTVSLARTDKGDLFVWGGKKGAGLPVVVSLEGLPGGRSSIIDASAVTHNGDAVYVVLADGQLFWKPRPRKSDKWRRFEGPLDSQVGGVVAGDEFLFVRDRASGRVTRHALRTGDAVPAQTIRVADVAHSSSGGLTVMVLAVHNTKGRIFGALHPEPLLKLATARGMMEWLVRTGCRYPSDLAAFTFAFPVLLKLVAKEKSRDGSVRVMRTDALGVKGAMGSVAGNTALHHFVKMLKKIYESHGNSEESVDTVRTGVTLLLQSWLDSRPPTQDARTVLGLTQTFLSEGEQAELWKRENLRSMPSTLGRRMSVDSMASARGAGHNLELEDVAALPAKSVALTLTALRWHQYSALATTDVVHFCMVAPDPAAFEMYPRVAEFVDFGNTMGRWAKMFVLRGGSKAARGERLRWLFAVVQELEALRNYDLAFHFSGAFVWELMPDIAKQSKVDLESMLVVVKRYGDKKFWSGPYQKAITEQQSMVPLLVYHSNSISGGFGGSDSLVTRNWENQPVEYLNVAKFRAIGDQQRTLEQIASWYQHYAGLLKSVQRDNEVYVYFAHVSAPSDAALTVMRSDIIKVSRHRESGKVTSIDAFSNEVTAAVSSRERRVVKWSALIAQLESEVEVVRLRQAPFLVCPRDAVLEGDLLPGLVKTLMQNIGDIEWASHEYWLLRRILLALVNKPSIEDIVMSAATLWERSVDAMPQASDALVTTFVDFVARGGQAVTVIKAAQIMEQTAVKLAPELDKRVLEFEEKMRTLKEKGGTLLRAQRLMTISDRANLQDDNSTIRAVKKKASDTDESVKLTKAQLEHYGAQRALIRGSQDAARDFAVLLDLWGLQEVSVSQVDHAVHFRVTHLGARWGEGENAVFVHHEPAGTRLSEFQDKLVALYETVFGPEGVMLLDGNKEMPAGSLKANVAYMQVAAVRRDGEASGAERGRVYVLEIPFVREGSTDPWKKRVRYVTEDAPTKKRVAVVDARTSLMSPIESAIVDIDSRANTIRVETTKLSPDKSTALILQQAMAPQTNTGLLKACAYLVDQSRREDKEVMALSLSMWDFLLAVRNGLAFFSTATEEDDLRVHHTLCRSFRDLLSLILPSLGPPHAENFGYASLYQFVSMMLPQGYSQPLIDSPMVTRRQGRKPRSERASSKTDTTPPSVRTSSKTETTRTRSGSSGRSSEIPDFTPPSRPLRDSGSQASAALPKRDMHSPRRESKGSKYSSTSPRKPSTPDQSHRRGPSSAAQHAPEDKAIEDLPLSPFFAKTPK